MEWWQWLIVSLAAGAGVVTACVALVRRSARGREILALSLGEKARFARALLADRGLRRSARWLLLALVAYLLLPFDIIPDFIPVIGQLDDLLVVGVVVALLVRLVPPERIDAAIVAAREGAARDRPGA